MVVNFIVQTISPDASFKPMLCFWEPYGFMIQKELNDVARTSKKEQESIGYILNRLQSEFLFRKQVTDAHNNNKREQFLENGIFRVSDRTFFCDQFNVVWQACYGCAFVMVLRKQENKALAENVLSTIMKYAVNIFDLVEQSSQMIISNPEKMACLLNVFLPAGQLLILNHRLVKIFQKDLEKQLADKT